MSKFKEGDIFFHPSQKVLVEVESMVIPETKNRMPNTDNEWLYNLHILNPNTGQKKPWKRYYEKKVIETLVKLENLEAAKVLFKDN